MLIFNLSVNSARLSAAGVLALHFRPVTNYKQYGACDSESWTNLPYTDLMKCFEYSHGIGDNDSHDPNTG